MFEFICSCDTDDTWPLFLSSVSGKPSADHKPVRTAHDLGHANRSNLYTAQHGRAARDDPLLIPIGPDNQQQPAVRGPHELGLGSEKRHTAGLSVQALGKENIPTLPIEKLSRPTEDFRGERDISLKGETALQQDFAKGINQLKSGRFRFTFGLYYYFHLIGFYL